MKILAFGEVMMRLMPSDYKRLTQTNHLEYLFSGTGVNILSGLSQMGDTTYLATTLPDNNLGYAAAAQLRKLGINDSFVGYQGNHMGIYILETGIGARASQVTYLNRKESSFGKSTIKDYNLSMLEGIDALHICGIALAMSQEVREVAYALAKEAKERGITVIFDCNFRTALWDSSERDQVQSVYEQMLEYADVVFAGYKDATLLLGIEADTTLPYLQQVEQVLQIMCKKYQIEVIYGTNRSRDNDIDTIQGYRVMANEFMITSPHRLTILDRVGGGDGFACGAIHAHLHGFPKQDGIEYAVISGVLAHTTYGDSPIVSKKEILNVMEYGYQDIQR